MTEGTTPEAAPKLSVREKICYGCGDIGNALAVSSISFWLTKYFTDVAGIGTQSAGLAMTLGRVWDAIADPVVGYATDHTNTRWGKRRPYLLFGAVPFAVFFALLWLVPEFESPVARFIYVLIALICFNTCFASVIVPYASLTASITSDYQERVSLTGYRMFASQSAFLLGATVPSALILWTSDPAGGQRFAERWGIDPLIRFVFGSWAYTARQGYAMSALLFSVLIVLSLLTVFFGIRERVSTTSAETAHSGPFSYIVKIVRQLFTNRPFRMAAAILCLSELAAALVAINLPYFLEYVLGLVTWRTQVLLSLFVGAIIAIPLWTRLARQHGKAETYKIVVLGYCLVLFLLPMLPVGKPFPAMLVAMLGGMCHAAALMIPWSMIPDIVEYDELHSEERREGLFYGGALFAYKLATAMGVLISTNALHFVGYVPNIEQSPGTVTGMKCIISVGPAVFLVLGSYVAWRYPLTAAVHRGILEKLRERGLEPRPSAGAH